MAKKAQIPVTVRLNVGGKEIEVTGPSDYVDKKVAEFLKTAPVSPPQQSIVSHQSAVGASVKATSSAQFFKKLGPKTDVDKVLAAAYFLEKIKNQENFTASEVRDTIKDAKNKPATNTNDAINSNIKKGFLMAAGDRDKRMAFVLTSDGEDEVESRVRGSAQ